MAKNKKKIHKTAKNNQKIRKADKKKNMKRSKKIRRFMKKTCKKIFKNLPTILSTVHTVLSIIQLLNPQS